jgi:hypothetical protein
MASKLHLELALMPDGWRRDVVVGMDRGIIASVEEPGDGPAERLSGVVLPGLPNLHSHAFQRAMSGLAERRGAPEDNFWSWREAMYRFALSMTPEQAESAARDRLEMGLSPFASDMELESAQNNNTKRQGYAGGTNYVGSGSAGTSPGPMWYPGINLPPMVKTILNTNPYYQAVKAGVLAPQALWRLGGSIGHLMNKLFPGGPRSSGQQAVQQPQQPGSGGGGGGGFKWPNIFGTRSSASGIPGVGVGISPTGQPAVGREWWSNDFGRWVGEDKYGTTPGNYWNQGGPGGPPGSLGLGFNVGGSGRVGSFNTAIGFGGSYGGGSNAGDTSRFAGGSGYNRPYTQAEYNTSPSFFGWNQGAIQGDPRASYDQYLNMFHPIGSVGSSTGYGGAAYSGGGPKGIGGGTPAFKPNVNQKVFAMGTSSVNPGLKLFHGIQKRKKK